MHSVLIPRSGTRRSNAESEMGAHGHLLNTTPHFEALSPTSILVRSTFPVGESADTSCNIRSFLWAMSTIIACAQSILLLPRCPSDPDRHTCPCEACRGSRADVGSARAYDSMAEPTSALTGPPHTAMRTHGVSDVFAAGYLLHGCVMHLSEPRGWRTGMCIGSMRSLYWARDDHLFLFQRR